VDTYNFYTGKEFYAHMMLGCLRGAQGATFRTFAPAAERVQLVLNDQFIDMYKTWDGNFWELYLPDVPSGLPYEYRIWHGGGFQDHCDPYGFRMELRPSHRSIVTDLMYEWGDEEWMATRSNCIDKPMNVYEMHAGSWKKRSGDQSSDDPADWYSYGELAEPLIEHLTAGGYTHVEFMPLNEHPFECSWGYQPTGFFAATSRYGTPQQLMSLIDQLHQAGIGVIMDFVPVHFATDAYGLANYDGTPLFEYPNDAVGVSEWGSHNFMHSRGETCSFLQSAANFWLGAYHVDALRMDAISRIIYWQGDAARGVNANAVTFVKTMNAGLKSLNPGIFLVAEDSTDFDGTTRPVDQGGLGYDYKWDMGWMHDTLDFFQTEPGLRSGNYHKLSFSMMYFRNERYLMPLSHDENVHGKATVAQKMSGDYDGKFGQARCLYLYMYAHPGKQLNFMGGEFAQLREWDENREQDWFMLSYPNHDAFWRFCRELGHIYKDEPALWEQDYDESGFTWREISADQDVVYAFERVSRAGERVLAVLNLSWQGHEGYSIQVPGAKEATVLIDTDWQRYGGETPDNEGEVLHIEDGVLKLDLPSCSGMLLKLG